MARMANGDGGDFLHYMHGPEGRWYQVTRLSDRVSEAAFGPDNSLYLLSRKDAPMGQFARSSPRPTFTLEKTEGRGDAEPRLSIDGFLPPRVRILYTCDTWPGGPSRRCSTKEARQAGPDGGGSEVPRLAKWCA